MSIIQELNKNLNSLKENYNEFARDTNYITCTEFDDICESAVLVLSIYNSKDFNILKDDELSQLNIELLHINSVFDEIKGI